MLLPALFFTSNMMQLCHLSLTVPSSAIILAICDQHCYAANGPIQLDQDLSSISNKQLKLQAQFISVQRYKQF